MALKQGNQNPQDNMIAGFSFASKAHVTQWLSYLTQWAEILTPQSNLTPQQVKNTVNYLTVASVVPKSLSKINQVGFTVSSLFSRDQQAAAGSLLQMEVILANTSLPLYTLNTSTSN